MLTSYSLRCQDVSTIVPIGSPKESLDRAREGAILCSMRLMMVRKQKSKRTRDDAPRRIFMQANLAPVLEWYAFLFQSVTLAQRRFTQPSGMPYI
jgi:hypothetical protein